MLAIANRAARAALVLLMLFFLGGCGDSRVTKLTREWVWDWPGGKDVHRFDTDGYYTVQRYRRGGAGTYYDGSQKYKWALEGNRLTLGGDPHELIALTDKELRYKNKAGGEFALRPITDADRQQIRPQPK
jgi:hypothetical protein